MIQLPIQMTVAHDRDETPASLCSRNALLVGRSARDFCRDAGFTFQAVVDGKSSALQTLAHRCRADFGRLASTATVKISERRYTIGDQIAEANESVNCCTTEVRRAGGAVQPVAEQHQRLPWRDIRRLRPAPHLFDRLLADAARRRIDHA